MFWILFWIGAVFEIPFYKDIFSEFFYRYILYGMGFFKSSESFSSHNRKRVFSADDFGGNEEHDFVDDPVFEGMGV